MNFGSLLTLSGQRRMLFLAVWGAVGIFCYFTALGPWLFGAWVLCVMTCAVATKTSQTLAFLLSVLSLLGIYCFAIQLFPALAASLAIKNFILLAFLAVLSLAVLLRRGKPLPTIAGRTRPIADWSPLFFGFLAAAGVVWLEYFAPDHVSWAMRGDAVWNTVSGRLILADGGMNASAHPNPSPLTAALLAAAMAPGRELIAPESLLSHDLVRVAQLLIVLTFLACSLTALIVSQKLIGVNSIVRFGVIVAVGALPLTWFYSGFAFTFGFFNSSVALVILLAVWLAWLAGAKRPTISIALLSLGALTLLATWAPLAPIPVVLMLLTWRTKGRRFWLATGQRRIVSVLAFASPVVYFVTVTLGDLLRESSALGVNGGIFDLGPLFVLVVVVLTVAALLTESRYSLSRHELAGLAGLLFSAFTSLAYLLYQRRGTDSLWGYYPVKMAWMLVLVLLIILSASLLSWLKTIRGNRWATALIVASSGALVVGLMWSVSAPSLSSFFTPVSVVSSRGIGNRDNLVKIISELATPGTHNIAAHLLPTPEEDLFVNNWLLQLTSQSSQDEIRLFSFYLDGSDPSMVCQAASAWHTGVVVNTSDVSVRGKLANACPTANIEVLVR